MTALRLSVKVSLPRFISIICFGTERDAIGKAHRCSLSLARAAQNTFAEGMIKGSTAQASCTVALHEVTKRQLRRALMIGCAECVEIFNSVFSEVANPCSVSQRQ